jgi:hypothetical protein
VNRARRRASGRDAGISSDPALSSTAKRGRRTGAVFDNDEQKQAIEADGVPHNAPE